MSETQAISFSCPSCGKTFRWKQQIVGKRYTCKCGIGIIVPKSAGSIAQMVSEEEMYDVEVTEVFQPVDAAKKAPTNTISGRMMGIPAKRPASEVVHEEHEEWEMPTRAWEMWVAGICGALGLIFTYVVDMYLTGERERTFFQVMPMTTAMITMNCVLVGVAVFLIAIFMVEVELEHPLRICVKLVAVALLPPVLGSFAQAAVGGINGDILKPFVIIGSYLGLFLLLFRLPILASLACVFVIFVVRVGVEYAIHKIEGANTGSWV